MSLPASLPLRTLRNGGRHRAGFVLVAGDTGAALFSRDIADAPSILFAASRDAENEAAIMAVLAQNPRAQLTIMSNALAQDFKAEDMPRLLNPLDRAKLIRRRLQQAFPNARMTAHLSSGPGKPILLAALQEASAAFTWQRRLHTRTANVGLLPVECADLANHLMPDSRTGWALVACFLRTGGLRQIVTRFGEPVFTRLTSIPPDGASPAEIADAIARDIRASLGYLQRLGMEDGTCLHAALLLPHALDAPLAAAGLPFHQCIRLGPREAALRLGLPLARDVPEPLCADALFAAWMSQRPSLRLPLATPETRGASRTTLIRRAGMATACLILTASLAVTGHRAEGLWSSMAAINHISDDIATLRQKRVQAQNAGSTNKEIVLLRTAIERRRLFALPSSQPWETLESMSAGLNGRARLVRLEWTAADEQSKPGPAAAQTVSLRLGLRIISSLPEKREEMLAKFRSAARDLARALPAYNVSIERLPFPALPQDVLSNATRDAGQLGAATADLILRKTAP